MDKIFLKELEVECVIGIFKRERIQKQRVLIDLELPTDAEKSSRFDRIRDALDYKKIAKSTLALAQESRFYLIETLAERISQMILHRFNVPWVTVTVAKPGAVRFSKNVGVTVTRQLKDVKKRRAGELHRVFISAGSNRQCEVATQAMIEALGTQFDLIRVSSIYESQAIGPKGQAPFWNFVAEIQTVLKPEALKKKLGAIEAHLGRRRTTDRFAPRTADLDIVFYDRLVMKRGRLQIPHPDAVAMPYVLVPMAEIAPNFTHPVKRRTILELVGAFLEPENGLRKIKTPSALT